MSKLMRVVVRFIFLASIFAILFLTSGCKTQTDQEAELSGILKIDGSTTVYPVAKKAAEIFMERHPKVAIIVTESSSGEGYEKILERKVDIADATRAPHEGELDAAKSKGINLHMTIIGNDGIGIITHKSNPITDISTSDLKKIFFTGEINDWSQITNNKKNGKINVYGTNPNISGTADLFISKIAHGEIPVKDYRVVYPTPDIISVVAADTNGIAFTPIKWADNSIKLLSLDGVFPTPKSILEGSNPLSRKMLMVTNGVPNGLEREFLLLVVSKEGQKIVEDEGFIPITK